MFENKEQKQLIKNLAESIVLTEEKIKTMKREVLVQRDELIVALQQSGQKGSDLTSGLHPHLTIKPRISKIDTVEDPEFFAWLADNDMADIIKPTVHSKTLQSTLEGHLAKGKKLPVTMFKQFDQTTVGFTNRSKFVREFYKPT
jgi:hypothetical protein